MYAIGRIACRSRAVRLLRMRDADARSQNRNRLKRRVLRAGGARNFFPVFAVYPNGDRIFLGFFRAEHFDPRARKFIDNTVRA